MFKFFASKASAALLAAPIITGYAMGKDERVRTLFGIFGSNSNSGTRPPTKTYIWGNGVYMAKPDSFQFRNFEPKLIENFNGKNHPHLRDIVFGPHHEAGIDNSDQIYIWNKHILSSAKEPHINDNVRVNVQRLDIPGGAAQVAFTKGFIWGLNNKGEVFQWPITTKMDDTDKQQIMEASVTNKCRKVESLNNIAQISCGEDHFVALTKTGEVYVMGDDTFGQCGLGAQKRKTAPPFYQKREKAPKKIEDISNVKKIIAGGNHTLALTNEGMLYGWGSNSSLQLAHEPEFAAVDTPLIAVFAPVRLDTYLPNNLITDMAAGGEFSMIVTKNKANNETEVYGCGNNLHGQIGAGVVRHITDILKVESLSNYKIPVGEGKEQDVDIEQISCGNHHCMALLNIGAILEWGGNEFGQLGNRRRAFSENPIIVAEFAKSKEKVLKISCGFNNSAVITEEVTETKTAPADAKPTDAKSTTQ